MTGGGVIRYYRRDGTPCKDVKEWRKEFDAVDRTVANDVISGSRIFTFYTGIAPYYSEGDPLIFDTVVFSDDKTIDAYEEQYSTEKQALEGHARIVKAVKSGTLLNEGKKT